MKPLVITLVLLLLVGCGKEVAPTPTLSPTTVPSPTPMPSPTPLPTETPTPTPSPSPTPTSLPSPTATQSTTGTSSAAEPVDVLANVVDAIQALDSDQGVAYFCAERESEMRDALDVGLADLAALGVDPDELLEAFSIDLGKIEYQELSRDDGEAVVNVSGAIRLDFDADVLKEVLRRATEASGSQVTEQELDLMVSLARIVAARGVPLDTDIRLIQEDGEWLVCDDLDFLQDLFQLALP
jgi:hypothetical protein